MSEPIRFTSRQGDQVDGALAVPAGSQLVPGVVVVQEWWGLTEHIRGFADRWAAAGMLALAPDLYRGTVATSPEQAGGLMRDLDRARALADLAGAVDALRAHPRCSGAIIVTGYCMGGALSLGLASTMADLAAVIPFYGVPQTADLAAIRAPVQLHVAQHDDWVTPALAEATATTIRSGGASVEVHTYDAAHAFCNDTRPEVFHAASAALAWQRAVTFARAHAAS